MRTETKEWNIYPTDMRSNVNTLNYNHPKSRQLDATEKSRSITSMTTWLHWRPTTLLDHEKYNISN